MRLFISHFFRYTTFIWLLIFSSNLSAFGQGDSSKPNIILIFIDDLGYGDIGVYGGGSSTPNIDELALGGIRFTNFYVTSSVCSASRASLLTGSYSSRLSIPGALMPRSVIGLNKSETTIAELLKTEGYATALIGKWHLGDHPEAGPVAHGFDYYFGLPYSNDMSSKIENNANNYSRFPPLPLLRNREVVEFEPDQATLTRRYTEEAIRFINQSGDSPFFLYFAHTFPHVPLYASADFGDAAGKDLYHRVLREIDWSIGEILTVIDKNELAKNTLIMLASDNGPWAVYGNHSGDCGPFRGGKHTVWECGIRVPFVAKWQGRIPEGAVSNEVVAAIDILPTIASLVGANLPELKIDGAEITHQLYGEVGVSNPHDALFFYHGDNELQAMRWGKWKLHFPHEYRRVVVFGMDGSRGSYEYLQAGLELYNLEVDAQESRNVAGDFPQVLKEMQKLASIKRTELGDSLNKLAGDERREAGIYEYRWYQRYYWWLERNWVRMRAFFSENHDAPWYQRLYQKLVSLFE